MQLGRNVICQEPYNFLGRKVMPEKRQKVSHFGFEAVILGSPEGRGLGTHSASIVAVCRQCSTLVHFSSRLRQVDVHIVVFVCSLLYKSPSVQFLCLAVRTVVVVTS